ncbi:hypothetical protein GH714_035180 [Hevea brasiliensis]|uniref:Uncharacterized protein n=1 Tax=Hevea brasiliensis TaxID=3981 RepID=A0A6A6L6L6_HEVBR|nr:hypothetical protein GH714_035180 [Hevea brasiliensis]
MKNRGRWGFVLGFCGMLACGSWLSCNVYETPRSIVGGQIGVKNRVDHLCLAFPSLSSNGPIPYFPSRFEVLNRDSFGLSGSSISPSDVIVALLACISPKLPRISKVNKVISERGGSESD